MHHPDLSPLACLQAVIFDWAGTTVDYGCQAPVQAFVESFAAFGVSIDTAEAREPMGMEKRAHVAAICAMPRVAEAWKSVYGAEPNEADIDRVYQRVERVMIEVIQRYSVPMPGVVDAVNAMRSMGLRIGSCTGYPRSVGELLAQEAEKYGYTPDELLCATDVTQGRPAPDMCLELMRKMNIDSPFRAVKIGDTVNDVLEGLNAGMWVVGITLAGSLAGLSEQELNALPESEQILLHNRISDTLTAAGAHFTAPDVPSCLPLLRLIDENCQKKLMP